MAQEIEYPGKDLPVSEDVSTGPRRREGGHGSGPTRVTYPVGILPCALLFCLFFIISLALSYSGLNGPTYFDSASKIFDNSRFFTDGGLTGVIGLFPQRPIPMITFYANYLVAGMSPFSFRIVNVVLLSAASVCTVILTGFLLQLSGSWKPFTPLQRTAASILLGLGFLVHPFQSFVTLYIWQRIMILGCLFYFGSLIAYLAVRTGGTRHTVVGYAACLVLFICALASKENTVTLPVVLVILEICYFSRDWIHVAKRALVYFAISAACLGAESFVQRPHGTAENALGIWGTVTSYYRESGLTLTELLLTQCRVAFAYLSAILVPTQSKIQLVAPQIISRSLTDPPITSAAVFGIVALVSFGIALLRTRPLSALGILFFLVNLLPDALLVPQYMYWGYRPVLGMVGIGLVLLDAYAFLVERAATEHGRRLVFKGATVLVAVYIAFLATMSVKKADVWSNRVLFFERTVDAIPQGPGKLEAGTTSIVLFSLAQGLVEKGELFKAALCIRQSLELTPGHPVMLTLLGLIYSRWGQLDQAETYLEEAASSPVPYDRGIAALGSLKLERGKPSEAIPHLKRAVAMAPHDSKSQILLADAFLAAHEIEAGVRYFRRKSDLDAASWTSQYNFGRMVLAAGGVAESLTPLKKAVELRPSYWPAHVALGTAYARAGRLHESAECLSKALTMNPSDASIGDALRSIHKQIQRQDMGSGNPMSNGVHP